MKRLVSLIGCVLLASSLGAALARPASGAREWDLGDPLVERILHRLDRGEYRAVADTLGPLIESARAAGDSLRLGRLICARGRAELGVGEVARSMETLLRAQEMAEARADTVTWMTALGVRALGLNRQGRFGETVEVSRRQIELAQASHDARGEAFAQLSTGFAELNRNRLGPAREAYLEAIDLFEGTEFANWQLTALIGLGRVETDSGQLDAARATYDNVISLARDVGDRRSEADATNNLGVIEFQLGHYDLAVQRFERACAMQMELDDPLLSADLISNLAAYRATLGDYEAAIEMLDGLRKIAREQKATMAYLGLTSEMGVVRYLQKRYAEAVRLQREVLENATAFDHRVEATYELALGLARMDSLESALTVLRGADVDRTEGLALERRILAQVEGSILRRLGRPREAVEVTTPFVEMTEDQPYAPSFFAGYSRMLSEAGQPEAGWDWIIAAVDRTEKRRRAMGEETWRELLAEAVHPLLVDAVGAFHDHRKDVDGPDDRALFDLLQRNKARTMIERISSPTREVDTEVEPATLTEVQESILEAGDVLLDYYVGNDFVLLFTVTSSTIRFAVLNRKSSELQELVDLFGETIVEAGAQPGAASVIAASAHRLRDILLSPAAAELERVNRVILCPDGYLASLPFGLIPTREGSDAPLLLTAEIARTPSVSMLPRLQPSSRTREGLITLAAADADLAGATDEIHSLTRRFADVRSLEGLVPGLTDSLAGYAVIHVAAHTEVDGDRPWYSGIRLESPSASDSSGVLVQSTHIRAIDILDHRLDAGLAVLAACESGLGKLSHGQGVLGLSSALLVANVASVVSTLWPVDDAITRDLMLAFYDRLAEGLSVARALREAQLEIRRHPQTAHPYYWAGFVVTGKPDTRVSLRRRRGNLSRGTLVGLALGGLALGALFVARSRRRPVSAPV